MATKDITIDELTIDGGTQNRVKINEDVVEEYHEILSESNGEWPFPPLDVFHDGSANFVADGFHRFLAANRAKRKDIPCKIHKGTAVDARIFGMTANDRNGLRMSRADKRACVVWLLENGGKMTQKEIAEKAGVTARTVKNIIAERNPTSIAGKASPSKLGTKGRTSPSTPISGEYQQRAMKKNPDGESVGVSCSNCDRYGRNVDWWYDGACVLCREPLGDELPGEDSDSAGMPEESSSEPPRKGKDKPAADYGKCPNCAGTKWAEDEDGVACAKCHHPYGEPAGETDEERLKTQRQKTVKTVEALMRAFDDLQVMLAKPDHDDVIRTCKALLKTAKGWK